ncbi:TolC family protein, partial [candidate division KSB1 bacterium]|nr:TolC family protein [candidate division KSB1 bacterium]
MKFHITLFYVLLASTSGQAQAPLPLEEALRLARQNNLQLKKQEQRQKFAELEVAIKRGQRLPSLDFNASTSYTDEIAKLDIPVDKLGLPLPPNFAAPSVELGGHDRTDFALGVRQPIFTGGRLRTLVDLAKTALASEETRLAFLQQQTAYQVHLLFYQAQNLKKENRIQASSLNRLTTQLTQMRHLLHAAQVVAYDTLQVLNQALQVKILMEQNLRDQRLMDLQMARVLDLAAARPIAEIELPQVGAFGLSLDSLKAAARQSRPELRSVQLGQKSSQLNRKMARGNYFPEIGAEAKYHYGKPALNQVANEWMDYTTVGVNLQWNLWRGQQDRHRVQEAEVEYT